jgi:hypothetical protein
MTANFYDASVDWPRLSFSKVALRMLGPKGFSKAKNAKLFKAECRKAFSRGRLCKENG